jgi:hypothetical protein
LWEPDDGLYLEDPQITLKSPFRDDLRKYLPDAHARDGSGDDQALDLGGAFEDGVDLPGTTEGRSATTADLPSDLQFVLNRSQA